ncbi:MAG: hypothetical protein IK048_01370 [Clostridia bacterium]|nr:hypothetical protein [Clostridia bacterium]
MTDKIESVLNDESAIAGNGVVDDTKEEQNPVNLPLEEVQDGNQEPAVEGAPAEDALEEGELAEGTPNEDVVASQEEVQNGKKRKRRKRRKIDEYTLENDIRYRGPLSYRWLRIFAWLFLILSQVGMLLALGGQLDAGLAERTGLLATILKMLSEVMMPLFLIATFATILNGSKKFASMLVLYGGAALIFYLLFVLFHERYVASILMFVFEIDHASAVEMIDMVLSNVLSSGYLSFNIFVDLFLCTLLGFFLVYCPKKVFVGKKLGWFRAFAILPIAWEVASFILKMFSAFGKITLSPYFYPLLTTKPPMTFIVFIAIVLFIKTREHIYRKRGKTHEQYQEFLQTKANSWQFSRYLALIMFVAGILDLIVYLVLTFAFSGVDPSMADETAIESITFVSYAMLKSGIGGSSALFLAAPIMLLFSYTRQHKNTRIEIFIPILAIIVLVFVFLEAMVIATNMVGTLSALIQKLSGN